MKISKIEYKLFSWSKNLRKIKKIKSTVSPRIMLCKINVFCKIKKRIKHQRSHLISYILDIIWLLPNNILLEKSSDY